jgi:hypothetical protein
MDSANDADDIASRMQRLQEIARSSPGFNRRPPVFGRHKRPAPPSSDEPTKARVITTCHRGCPPEPDDERTSNLSHRDHVRAFDSGSGARDEVVLEALRSSFEERNAARPYQPGRPGDWFTGFYFFKVHGIKAANSCASRLRQNPYITENDLDVDSSQVPADERKLTPERNEWWRYRICHRQDSERLQREAAARERRERDRQLGQPGIL